jgi:hypothetical protein
MLPLEKITKHDKFFLQNFNFYNKNIDFSKFEEVNDGEAGLELPSEENYELDNESSSNNCNMSIRGTNITTYPSQNSNIVSNNGDNESKEGKDGHEDISTFSTMSNMLHINRLLEQVVSATSLLNSSVRFNFFMLYKLANLLSYLTKLT